MKRTFLGVYIYGILGGAQAVALENSGVFFPPCDCHTLTVAREGNSNSFDTFAATSAGIISGNEKGYLESVSFGFGTGGVWTSNPGATTSQWLDTGPAGYRFSDNAARGHGIGNGGRQEHPIAFTVVNGQSRHDTFDYLLGISDGHAAEVDYDDSVIADTASAPDLRVYAMLLTGLGLLGLAAFHRRSDPFD